MRRAVPPEQRATVADAIRRYADDMDARYRQITDWLTERLGDEAQAVIKELNHHSFAWERGAAERLEGRKKS
jgi:hypothetical protein